MYAPFFGLNQEPFSIAPDPRYLFMSERHREALAHLLYGVGGGGGFVLLTGEIGAGKTTVCRCFLEQIPRRCNVAYIFNPKLSVIELLKSVCEEFRIPYEQEGPGRTTVKDWVDPLNEFLLRTHAVGQNNVLIIDEAQNLSTEVLEQLRLLTNLETNERKLLQIILIGQPELRKMLARPELEQLAQRVIARYHLKALSQAETAQYIAHRLSVAGVGRGMPFNRAALRRIYQLTRGVPRRINLLCDRAMLGAYALGRLDIGRPVIDQAASEVFDRRTTARRAPAYGRGVALGVGLAVGAVLVGAVSLSIDRSTGHVTAAAGKMPASSGPSKARDIAIAASGSTPTRPPASSPAPVETAALAIDEADASLVHDEQQGWRQLARSWNVALEEGDACLMAMRRQLRCFRSNGGLTTIRQLARPSTLTLRDNSGRAVYVLLTGLGNQSATLDIGGRVQKVTLVSLAKVWKGDFSTFWRVPPGYAETASGADSKQLNRWLEERLASFDGESASAVGSGSDAALKSRVQSFQLAQGLKPDGIAGPTTLMQIGRASGIDEPRLAMEP